MFQTTRSSIYLIALLWIISSCNSALLTNKLHGNIYPTVESENLAVTPARTEAAIDDETGAKEVAAAETNHMKYAKPTTGLLDLKHTDLQRVAVNPPVVQVNSGKAHILKQHKQTNALLKDKKSYSRKFIREEGKKTDGFALASMILGIASIFLILLPVTNIIFLSLASAILAIVFSTIGLRRIRQNPETLKGKGFGIAGLVTGIVFLALVLILIVTVIASFN
jgi:hypothetical protein